MTDTPLEDDEGAGTINLMEALDDLETLKEQNAELRELVAKLGSQVEHLAATASSDITENHPETVSPPELEEGWKRYGSRFTELTLMRVEKHHRLVDGIAVPEILALDEIDFEGGVYQTNDPDVITWLEQHPQYNMDFWEDQWAVKRHTNVQVHGGVKATVVTPQRPLSAPMT